MRRFFRWLRAQPGRLQDCLDRVEEESRSPEEKFERMKDLLIRHREEAVIAITQKNRLKFNLEKARDVKEQLRIKAAETYESGDRDKAHGLLQQLISCDLKRAELEGQFVKADAHVERIKVAIKAEEEEINRRAKERKGKP